MNKRLLSLLVIAIFIMANTFGAFAAQDDSVKAVSKYGTPAFKVGDLTAPSTDTPENIAVKYFNDNKAQFKANGSVKVKAKTINDEGATVVRVQQTYNNLPVFDYEQKVVIDKQGVVKSVSGTVVPDLDKQAKANAKATVSAADAMKTAKAELGFKVAKFETEPTAELGIYLKDDVAYSVYNVNLNFLNPEPGNWNIYVDATTGTVVDKLNSIEYVTGTNTTNTGYGVLGGAKTLKVVYATDGLYYLQDNTRGNGIFTYSTDHGTSLPGYLWPDDNGVWDDATWDAPCVDAHYYAGATYDYYKNVHGRNSYNNAGAALKATCHYGSNYNNAFWNGTQMVYGCGDGVQFRPLSGGIDVDAHELTHAVTGYEANLTYSYESGAISEAYSDIFGTIVEFYANVSPDWLIGEDVYTPGTAGDALRSMSNPPAYGQPDKYANRYTGTSDNGGVHTNSGIINKAAYLLAVGGTFNGYTVTAIGRDKMDAIFYKALIDSVVSSETMSQLRAHCITAATNLYGSTSTEVAQVKNAFSAVGVF